jgi:VWFA-related protein
MNPRSSFFYTVSLLAFSCLPAISPAQPPDSSKSAAAQGREVVLQVLALNHKGRPVSDLKISDLTLTEDGHSQTIRSFTREINLPFRLGLLVDTSRSVMGAMVTERKATGKFVDAMLPETPSPVPNSAQNQVFLIHFDREVELLRDFTASREKLHRELDEMAPTRLARRESQGSEASGGYDGYGGGEGRGMEHGRGGSQLCDAIFLASDELMKSQTGRKALIVFSDGVDHNSKETLNDAVDAADRAGVAVYTIYFKGEEELRQNGYAGPFDPQHGGIGLSSVGDYPGSGGRHGGSQKARGVNGKKILEKIAQRTGGRYFEAKNKENLDEIYSRIAEELRGQYLLTYTPERVDKGGGFHKIALKANHENLTVVTREGYYAPGNDAK